VKPVLVDSNVLLDVVTADATWADWSSSAISAAADEAPLIINAIVYGEVSIGFARKEDLDDALPHDLFERHDIPFEAAFLAGKCYVDYRRRGGARRSPLPDFYIGAHAAVADFRLLTRDATRYRTYFPRLELISPG
jgi:predicted nucleic acid-binding protein